MKTVNICQENLAFGARKSIAGIENIDMDIIMSELVVLPCDGDEVIVEMYFGNPHHLSRFKVNVVQNGNTIHIELKKARIFLVVSPVINVITRVFIPKDYQNNILVNGISLNTAIQEINANNINVSLVSGRCMLNQVKATNLQINSVSGNVQINEIYSDTVSIESKSGTVLFENMHLNHPDAMNTSLYIDSISGKVDAFVRDCLNNIRIKTISGAVSLTVPSDYQFNSHCNCISGKVKTNSGRSTMAGVNNHKQNTVDINTISGSITINN